MGVIVIVVALVICIVAFMQRTWVNSRIDDVHERISDVVDTTNEELDNLHGVAKNAQGIASNALSSAQRAESKFVKHIEETVKKENA